MQFMGVSQFGVYRLKKLLGKGSFSEVYLAEHITNGTEFAIKIFYQQLASEGEKSDFLGEVSRFAQLKHSNIINVVEFGVENRIPFVVMDYAPYGNLREIHAKGLIVPIITVVEHVKSIAAALEYLHYHKFVHRHLEPEKVLVGRNNTLLLGLPSLVIESAGAHTTQESAHISTGAALDYMAPEHIRRGPCKESDQYALGVMAYEWLSGYLPFRSIAGESVPAKIGRILSTEPDPLHANITLSPKAEIYVALSNVIMKAITREPQARYKSVEEFARALEKAAVSIAFQRPDLVGTQLGNYQLTRLIGQGGFANVYLGEHPVLKSQAAIKVLDMKLTSEDQQKFLAEARMLANLRHPQIIKVLDFGIKDDIPFLIMDYAPGGTMRQLCPKGSRLAPATVLPYVKQIASALNYAHYRGLIHRDVKPENILLNKNNQILLSDFGIAVSAHNADKHKQQEILGTMQYMAPEQIEGKADVASDQYAFAIMVYEWLCGTCPFTGTTKEMMIRHLGVPPESLRNHTPTISPAIDDVVLRALLKDPLDRYPTVLDFAAAFEEACQLDQAASLPTELPATLLSPRMKVARSERVKEVRPPAGELIYTHHSHSGPIATVAWAPNRSFLLSGGADGVLEVWSQDQTRKHRGHSGAITAAAWSPDGRHIASASEDETVQVRNVKTGDISCIYKGHAAGAFALGWSPDSKRIASAGDDETVYIWDATNGKTLLAYIHSGRINTVAWSHDGGRIASASVANVQVWETTLGRRIHSYRSHSGEVYTVVWSLDDSMLASGGDDKTVQIWNTNTAQTNFIYTGHMSKLSFLGGGSVRALAWAPQTTVGAYVVSAGNDKTVQIWNARNGEKVITYKGHTARVNAISWSPDGKKIASASDDGTVQIWTAP